MKRDIKQLIDRCDKELQPVWNRLEEISLFNHEKVLNAFQQYRLSSFHLQGGTGYGYDDLGREAVESIYSNIFRTDAALVRPQIISGTHAISLCLFGVLRPGDNLLSICGKPYDTLDKIIGLKYENDQDSYDSSVSTPGSLRDLGVKYSQVELLPNGGFDFPAIERAIHKETKMILIQRSRGYTLRPALSIAQIEEACRFIRELNKEVIIFVDNCYGEFVEKREPIEAGADLIAGSLIKNIGGGIAPTGGYIAGRSDLVELAAYRWTAPGVGSEIGPSLGFSRSFLQGLFLAPMIVSEALKGAILTAKVFETLGYDVFPASDAQRSDIVQSVILRSPKEIIDFCHGIQAASPIDSHVAPEPWAMPGYNDPVIMAAGTFTQGSSIELSCDAPIRPPYTVYMQGGLSSNYVRLALSYVLERLHNN